MRRYPIAFAALGLALAAPAGAQTLPTPAETGGITGTTTDANRAAAAAADNQAAATDAQNQTAAAEAQAQYDLDLAAYDAAVRAQHAQTMADEAHYRHQRRAYADAMRAWRAQVAACRAGNNRACNAPSPDPAAFW